MPRPKSNATLIKENERLREQISKLSVVMTRDVQPDPEIIQEHANTEISDKIRLPFYRVIFNALFRPVASNRRHTLDITNSLTFSSMDRSTESPATIWRRDGRGKGPSMVCTRHINGTETLEPFDMYAESVIPPTTDTPAQYYATVRQPNVLKVISPGTSGWQKLQAGMYIGVLVVLVITVGIIIVVLLGGSNT